MKSVIKITLLELEEYLPIYNYLEPYYHIIDYNTKDGYEGIWIEVPSNPMFHIHLIETSINQFLEYESAWVKIEPTCEEIE